MPTSRYPSAHRAAILRLLAALGLVGAMLGGCYTSGGLLADPSDAVHPLADGVYARSGDAADRFRLTLQPDGWYAVERLSAQGLLGETHRVLVTPLGDALQLSDDGADGVRYAVGRIIGRKLYLAAPDCVDPLDRNDALDAGMIADDDDAQVCRFKTRGALAAALTAFAGHADFGAPFMAQ